MGTLISCTPAVWQAPLRYRALQRTLLSSLRQGKGRKTLKLNDACIRDLDWWANGGLRANHLSPWRPPTPTVQIRSDASYYAGGATNDKGLSFQHPWLESERDTAHINLLELRAARLSLRELASPGDIVRFHLDNIMAIAYIRKLGGTHSSILSAESRKLWLYAIQRNITILPPHWLSSEDNVEANFLSRHNMQRWDFKLVSSEFRRICQR